MTVLSLCRACTRGNYLECAGGDCHLARSARNARWAQNFFGLVVLASAVTMIVVVLRAVLG